MVSKMAKCVPSIDVTIRNDVKDFQGSPNPMEMQVNLKRLDGKQPNLVLTMHFKTHDGRIDMGELAASLRAAGDALNRLETEIDQAG